MLPGEPHDSFKNLVALAVLALVIVVLRALGVG
jgi:hypothetical protein